MEPLSNEKLFTLPSGVVVGTWQNNMIKFSNNIDFNQGALNKHLIEFFDKN